MSRKINMEKVKLIIPCAGNGTRMTPASAFFPKEFLPVPHKGFIVPAVLSLIWNAVDAGILEENIKIVVSPDKYGIFRNAFSKAHEDLARQLRQKGKAEFAEKLDRIPRFGSADFVVQTGPYGNATPLYCAVNFVLPMRVEQLAHEIIEARTGDSKFSLEQVFKRYENCLNASIVGDDDWILYMYPDDLFLAKDSNDISQMIEAAEEYGCSVMAAKRVESDSEYDSYGIIDGSVVVGTGGKVMQVNKIVEKPGIKNAPSDQASVSGYLFAPGAIVQLLEDEYEFFMSHDCDGAEFMIQPAIQASIDEGNKFVARKIDGEYCDTGNPRGYEEMFVKSRELGILR